MNEWKNKPITISKDLDRAIKQNPQIVKQILSALQTTAPATYSMKQMMFSSALAGIELRSMTVRVKGKKFSAKFDEFNGLITLDLSRQSITQISEVKGLGDLANLEQLYLVGNSITEIKELGNLPNLQTLNLNSNNIYRIVGLGSLPNLHGLSLNDNQISKIEGLDTLTNLGALELRGNRITKIEGLDKLTKLEALVLRNNKITRIEGLDKLVNLELLMLEGNKITKIQGLGNLAKLRDLLIDDDRIAWPATLLEYVKIHTGDKNRLSGESSTEEREEVNKREKTFAQAVVAYCHQLSAMEAAKKTTAECATMPDFREISKTKEEKEGEKIGDGDLDLWNVTKQYSGLFPPLKAHITLTSDALEINFVERQFEPFNPSMRRERVSITFANMDSIRFIKPERGMWGPAQLPYIEIKTLNFTEVTVEITDEIEGVWTAVEVEGENKSFERFKIWAREDANRTLSFHSKLLNLSKEKIDYKRRRQWLEATETQRIAEEQARQESARREQEETRLTRLREEKLRIEQELKLAEEQARQESARQEQEEASLTRLREVLMVSTRIKIAKVAELLNTDEKLLWDRLIDWAGPLRFKIDGDDIVVTAEGTDVFIKALEEEFVRWGHSEKKD